MAIIKCKMCGGDLDISTGATVAECEYCGTQQTVPVADNEKKMTLFGRANRLRLANEFDKAAGIYESIVAEFPEEAEAYWGLVLCRYGIEYVDDPATGKKVPTCHRSSFDSVMEDSDFEQATENADAVARRVYREEAKAIEDIRRGILEVSGKEEPYDIFICYKETGEDGQRTLDSVLAQDVYDALTEKGYRVFFSRITLEDKLGTAYEPYIFAALNSAKIMLAIGTDYEHFNAVWVKNEWSRFLKLMEKDKSKHLIPCYKGIDAYDMPKEFARLQAQDLGKMGAIQDILRGIEKLLPKATPVTVVQEKVVVGGSGDSKIASLLDRGNMALEDGDWAKADSFFEEVLNNDSKNAQAYLGKTLAQEMCRTFAAFTQKRKDAPQRVREQKLSLEPNRAHVDEAVQKYSLTGYVEKSEIGNLYTYDLTYHSDVAERKQQYENEKTYWADHKQLSRAEKFAAGPLAETLAAEKKALLDAFSDRVKQAEAAEAAAKEAARQRYEAHLKQADEKAEALYNDGLRRLEQHYQTLLETAQTSTDVATLTETAGQFEQLGDYRDSRSLAEHCRKRAAEEQAKIDAENERQRVQKEKKEKERKAKNKKIAIWTAAMISVAIVAVLIVTLWVIPNNKYNDAVALSQSDPYAAAVAFDNLGDFKDARQQSRAIWDELTMRESISARSNHTVGLRSDGTVIAVGSNLYDQCDVAHWTDIVDISAGRRHTVGLRSDGTVVAVGDNYDGQCDVAHWTDIVAISAGLAHTVGLRSDGTVIAVGDNYYGQCDVAHWTDIVAISAGSDHTVGLRSDGTVIAAGPISYGRCDVAHWTDIVAISAGGDHTVGLRSDGTVVAVGHNGSGQCNVAGWTDIVAISAGYNHTVGLRSDGTVVAAGSKDSSKCNVAGWTDIVAISAGEYHTVGLRSNGTVVAVGDNYDGQCDVADWSDIMMR